MFPCMRWLAWRFQLRYVFQRMENWKWRHHFRIGRRMIMVVRFLQRYKKFFLKLTGVRFFRTGQLAGAAVMHHNEEYQRKGSFVTFYTATGIGGSAFKNGGLFQGENGQAGAFGHIVVDRSDLEVCDCGARGCLESVVKRRRMQKRLTEQKEDYFNSCLKDIQPEEMTYQRLFAGSEAGDTLCQQEVKHYARAFAKAIQSLSVIYDPKEVVFQGDFGLADKVFQNALLESMEECKYLRGRIKVSYDRNSISKQEALGMAYLMLEEYLKYPEDYDLKR